MTETTVAQKPNVVGPEYLVPLLHRNLSTIKVDARRRPESLPPRLMIPGSSKLLWVEQDVIDWLNSFRLKAPEPPKPFTIKRKKKVNPA